MELLCLTGVEDRLQIDVKPMLKLPRNAGIKVGGLQLFVPFHRRGGDNFWTHKQHKIALFWMFFANVQG